MGRRLLTLVPLIFMVFGVLNGCAGSGPRIQRYKLNTSVQSCSIGILPIINRTDFNQGDKIIYRVMLSQFVQQHTGRIALEGDISDLYRELHINPWTQPTVEQMQIIASRLGVNILIGGEILEMREPMEGSHINPHLKIQLQAYNGEDGTILWSTYHERQGTDYRKIMHFGLNSSVSQLSNNIIEEILKSWKEEALLRCQK
jgi:hypothetical protein